VLGETEGASFGELRRSVHGISPKVLTQRLRQMERDTLIRRLPTGSRTGRVVYTLAPTGQQLHTALLQFAEVAGTWAGERPETP
jgi:DNA-binding HxlR family transcriptional regulator